MNDRVGVAAVYEANLSTPTAEWPRVLLQKAAKSLGLPATGPKERIMRYIRIATDDPRTWSREDFNLILPYLSIHQDVRGQANVLDVLRVGLLRGMVDPAGGLEPGGNQWTWARGYLGTNVYVFDYLQAQVYRPGRSATCIWKYSNVPRQTSEVRIPLECYPCRRNHPSGEHIGHST